MVTPYSEVRPCCRFDSSKYKENFMWSGTESLKSFYSEGIFKKLRDQAEQNLPVAGCHRCDREEELGIVSMRQKPFAGEEDLRGRANSELRLTTIELGVGRLCNLKCRTCDAFFSTKWESDAVALNEMMPDPNLKIDLDLIPNELLADLRAMKITGGEPCLHPSFHRLLERLVEHGFASNIEIEIFSNATVSPPPRMTAALAHFARVIISLSIDAVGEKNSYIRHPSQWNKINQVVRDWMAFKNQGVNRKVGFACTVSVFNILSIFEFLEWVQSLNCEDVVFQVVHDPPYLNISRLPLLIRRELHKQFLKQWEDFKKTSPTSFTAKIKKVEKLLLDEGSSESHLPRFWEQTAALDELRKEKFASVFPEIHQILTNYSL